MLDGGLVQQLLAFFFVERAADRRIENLFLDLRMHGERITNLRNQRFLLAVLARFLHLLELLEHAVDLVVVALQKLKRVDVRILVARHPEHIVLSRVVTGTPDDRTFRMRLLLSATCCNRCRKRTTPS